MVPAADGYLNDHIAATFHAAHYHRLLGEPTPKAGAMLARVVRDQKPDGSWLLNPPARDRHATFDAAFVLRQLGGDRPECRKALARAAAWALRCRNDDGGFGHFPGSTSDADAVYFQAGTLLLAGWLQAADPPPADPELLGWGHLFPPP
jgi:geranylgeranyl transferase type-2 subunit beta